MLTPKDALWSSPNCSPMGWGGDRVFYNRRNDAGMFLAYSCLPDGTEEKQEATQITGTGHRGISDVSSDGRAILVSIERQHPYSGAQGQKIAAPGRGTYCDVWLVSTTDDQALQLSQGGFATMWAKFSPDDHLVVWSQCITPATIFNGVGNWQMHLRTLDWAERWSAGMAGPDTIVAPTSKQRYYETYGFDPTSQRVLFASNLDVGLFWNAQIYSCALDGSAVVRHSPNDTWRLPWLQYCEFAAWREDQVLIFARTKGAPNGMEYWMITPDGTTSQLTTLGGTAGGFALEPGGSRMFCGVANPKNTDDITGYMLDLVSS